MIHKIHKIALVTDDVEGSVKFYTETLGLEVIERFPVEDDEDYVFLKARRHDLRTDAERNRWRQKKVSTISPSGLIAWMRALKI